MVQHFGKLIKIAVFLSAVFFVLPHAAQSQVSQDTTEFTIENPLQNSPQQYTIQGIEVEGLTATRPSFVISQLGFNEGSTITVPGQEITEAMQRLYQTGLFSNIKIDLF